MTAQPTTRAAKAAIRREQLLDTALALFSEHGYAQTSTRRIADAAGVTEGLIFHYFGSKDALLLEALSRQSMFAGRVLTLVQRASHGSARELLHSIADGFADVSPEEAARIGFFTAEAQVNPELRKVVGAGTAVMIGEIVALLERRVLAGELSRTASLGAAAHGFFGGFLFFFTQHRDVGRAAWKREASAFAASWADLCWRGMATESALSDCSTKVKRKPKR